MTRVKTNKAKGARRAIHFPAILMLDAYTICGRYVGPREICLRNQRLTTSIMPAEITCKHCVRILARRL